MRFVGLENVPQTGAFILVVNHQSVLDPVLAGIALKNQLCFMARDTLFKSKIFGPLLKSVKAIPVRRGEPLMAKYFPSKAASRFYHAAATPLLFPF